MLAASALLGASFALFQSTFQTWATPLGPAARGLATSLFVSAVFTGAAAAVAITGTIMRLRNRPRYPGP